MYEAHAHLWGPEDHVKLQKSYTAWFLESPLNWATEPECSIFLHLCGLWGPIIMTCHWYPVGGCTGMGV